MTSTPLTRRELIRRLGLAAASLPFLDALGQHSWAAPTPPKRLVSIVLQHGIFAQNWLPFVPTGTPISSDEPGDLLKPPSAFLQPVAFTQRDGCAAIDLTSFSGALSPVFSAKWQALKRKAAFIHNLGCSNHVVQGHTSTAMLGGYKATDVPGDQYGTFVGLIGETVDVTIARKLTNRMPLTLKIPDSWDDVRRLEVADRRGGQVSTRRNAADTDWEPVPYLTDPVRAWDRLFSGYVPPNTGPVKRDPNQRRIALLERTLSNVNAITRDQRLSAADRRRLDNHASILAAQRDTLANLTTVTPLTPAAPPTRPVDVPGSVAAFNEAKGRLMRAQFANAAAALKMNKEQVITIDTGLENEWLSDGLALGGSQAYHLNAGHLSNPSLSIIEECTRTQRFVFDAIADFLAELDSVEDPASGSTYLDNTLVLITNEHDGRPNGHLRGAVQSVLVGGFGTFAGGSIYDFARPALRRANAAAIYTGFSYSRLLYTVLQAFGVTTAEQSRLAIQGEIQTWEGADLTDWSRPLPGLT